MTRVEAVREWMDSRLGINAAIELAEHKEVPHHRHAIWYYFGGMTLFLFVIQVFTGILLLLYYRPSAENAFESVQFIITEVQFESSDSGTRHSFVQRLLPECISRSARDDVGDGRLLVVHHDRVRF